MGFLRLRETGVSTGQRASQGQDPCPGQAQGVSLMEDMVYSHSLKGTEHKLPEQGQCQLRPHWFCLSWPRPGCFLRTPAPITRIQPCNWCGRKGNSCGQGRVQALLWLSASPFFHLLSSPLQHWESGGKISLSQAMEECRPAFPQEQLPWPQGQGKWAGLR